MPPLDSKHRFAAEMAIKEHVRADGYDQQSGKPDRREMKALLEYVNPRIRELQAQGMAIEDAAKQAFEEARNNNLMDWRRGPQ